MSGALQAVYQNQRSFGATPPGAIGSAYGGGYYAGSISTAGNSVADYYLVIGPKATAEGSGKRWKATRTDTPGTSSVINGPANSAAMNNASHPAAQFCEALSIGGFTDWYMPAQNEVEVCYYNLKPTTSANDTASGINANSVPARASNYTTSVPAQTSVVIFQTGQAQTWRPGPGGGYSAYWSSTQLTAANAGSQFFDNGWFNSRAKDYYLYVRATRRVAV